MHPVQVSAAPETDVVRRSRYSGVKAGHAKHHATSGDRQGKMAKKAIDPFIGDLWNALVADKLGPGGHQTSWTETPVRIRNRFTRAAREVMGSGAAFRASVMVGGEAKQTRPVAGKRTAQESRGQRELMLPLMINMPSSKAPGKTTKR